jgi:phosphoribosyl 1,2-cyclic phosphodiesterase
LTTLYVLGSGSRGNCFAVESEGVALLIDAGFSAREVERRAERSGLELERVAGIVLTHEHGDHAYGAPRLAHRLGIPVLTTSGTWQRVASAGRSIQHRAIGLCVRGRLDPFTIEACPTSHDAADPLAVVVESSDGCRIGVAYDLGRATAGVRYLLKEANALVVEANHDEVQLRTSDYPPVVQRRIASSAGHLSNRAAGELLAELYHPGLTVIVLAHLSERCNTPAFARDAIVPTLVQLGYRGQLHVALQDEPLPAIAVSRGAVQLKLAL